MPAFNPQLIADFPPQNMAPETPVNAPVIPAGKIMPPATISPVLAPSLPPQQVFVPVPIPAPAIKKPMRVSQEVARKAQGIYPAEQQAKQTMIKNAKQEMPTPTGAWGSPA